MSDYWLDKRLLSDKKIYHQVLPGEEWKGIYKYHSRDKKEFSRCFDKASLDSFLSGRLALCKNRIHDQNCRYDMVKILRLGIAANLEM